MGRWVLQFDLAMLAVMLLPLALTWCGFTGPVLGRRARRRRVVNSVIIVFLALLMLIGPENVQAMHVEHMMYQALGPASLGATTTTKTVIYGYDANGNQTSVDDGTNTNFYVYDAENRLVKAEVNIDSPNTVATYTYDADGTRLSKTVLKRTPTPQVTRTHYLVDKNAPLAQVVAEIDESGTVKVKYVHGDDLISQTRDPNDPSPTTSYYHYDGQMSTRHLTDNPDNPQTTSAQETDSYTYEAFGALWAHTGETPNDFLYTGQQLDPNTGFYYLRARYYNPTAGRFVTRDPSEGVRSDPISLHKYLYCHADPANNLDPTGYGIAHSLCGFLATMAIRLMLFTMNHPYLMAAIGFVVNALLPAEVHEAMMASGLPPVQGFGAMGRAEGRAFKLLMNGRISRFFQKYAPQSAGEFWKRRGDKFAEFLYRYLFKGGTTDPKTGGNHKADVLWRNILIEIKALINWDDRQSNQLSAHAAYAAQQGYPLVYIFLIKPTRRVINQISQKGGTVFYPYDK